MHAEPAQRLQGLEQLLPDSAELAQLLIADPASEVRIAAAKRCTDVVALGAAWRAEPDPTVRLAIASALAPALATTPDGVTVQAILESNDCTDALRADVVRRAGDAERRRKAIEHIRDEAPLLELALGAEHAETRLAAAARVRSQEGLERLVQAAKDKDRGVARLARQRIDLINQQRKQQAEAANIISQLDTLESDPGPILTAVVELDRRWEALDVSGDTELTEGFRVARAKVHARFDREQETQRARLQFERRLREWLGELGSALALEANAEAEELTGLRTELAALRALAQEHNDAAASSQLDEAERNIGSREEERQALGIAQSLVSEAEQLATGEHIDSAQLVVRWQALSRAVRTPDLTRRFEAAVLAIEKRRIDQVEAAKQEASAKRHRLHGLLHDAEQALAAGQLQAARSAAEGIKPIRAEAGNLPKPTVQRISRLLHQLAELERWESFGQKNARMQLCDRAQALATHKSDPAQLAREVQALRKEWKALDEQHAGVPKALWERFDVACETAYAPAAKHFAELAARNKEARRRREEFTAAAAEQALARLNEPRDWREIEHWLRDADRKWRDGELGSVNPSAWKALDTKYKAALAPLRDALSAARDQARAGREALIEEALALAPKATERDALAQIKSIQARWREQARTLQLRRRDETALWERFRSACDAVFNARHAKRKEEDGRRHDLRRLLESVCAKLEKLALGTDSAGAEMDDHAIRIEQREQQGQWATQSAANGQAARDLEPRFKRANTAIDAVLSARAKSRKAAVWKTLAAKERLCDALDVLLRSGAEPSAIGTSREALLEQWAALPALPEAWERKMLARRDAALGALVDPASAGDYSQRVDRGLKPRSQYLVELELSLGLDSPADCQEQRLAIQVKQLKERFKGSTSGDTSDPGERLIAWCALPGVCSVADNERVERIFSMMGKRRAGS